MRATGENRRRTTRHEAGWTARYRAGSRDIWYQCRALDVSETGAGLLLFGAPVPIGGPFVLEVPVEDATVQGIVLHATVKNVVTAPDGTDRVGVEFAPLTLLETSVWTLFIQQRAGVVTS